MLSLTLEFHQGLILTMNQWYRLRKALTLLLVLQILNNEVSLAESLELKPLPGRLIHDASYLPRPPFWPPEFPWDGTGLNNDVSYRYGPSLIRYNGNHLHFWACSEGDSSVADYIRYKHSSNGGVSWTEDTIALAPSIGTADGWAICDPNIVKIGAYYYMAYTATDSALGAGLNNQIFVARSLNPDKNFQKWNGSGWGGNPAPIISYNGPVNRWGLGEPNMVVKANTLYLYYTEDTGTPRTRVATAFANNPNWPATLAQRGYAISNRASGEDQTDVKYLPEVNRFIATAVANRFSNNSYVHVWESSNGLRFSPVSNSVVKTHLKTTAHNLGMSGDYLGHAQMGKNEYIAYAYTGPDGSFGHWNTWLNQVIISGPAITRPKVRALPFLPLLLSD